MKELIKYLKKYRAESLLGPLFKLLEASLELMVPLVMAGIIDTGIRHRDMAYIFRMGGVLVLLGFTGLVFSITAQHFAAKAATGFGSELRGDLMAHVNRFSYQEIDALGTATLITRMTSDINQIQGGVNLFLRLFLRSPFVVVGAMAMAFTISPKAALVFVVAIPALSLVVFGIMLVSMPLYKKVQSQLDQVLLAARENLEGVRVIRAFNRQEGEILRFQAANKALVQFQVFVGKVSALLNPLTYCMINGAIILLLWMGGRQVNQGILAQGHVVALVNYMSQILAELVKLANLIITISKALACANRVNAIFQIEPSMRSVRQPMAAGRQPLAAGRQPVAAGRQLVVERGEEAPLVEFRNLEFTYEGSKEPALRDVSFQVGKGQTIGIIGGTGAGKSTLVQLIPRFYDATKGAVLVHGVDVREYPLGQLRGMVGMVPQQPVLFKGTLMDNLRWGKEDATKEEAFQALDMAQAREFVEEKGKGLSLNILQGGKNLSGGQKQRLTIARALVRRPEILVLDDSGSALDFATESRLRRAIREGKGDMAVIQVSQRVASIRHADLILVLDDGRVVGQGSHEMLLEGCQVYREICMSQLAGEEVEAHG